jgi:hypothetical protein
VHFHRGDDPQHQKRTHVIASTKRGRKRLFKPHIRALPMRVERTFAWEDKFKRLLLQI